MKQLNLNGNTLLAVNVPENSANDFRIMNNDGDDPEIWYCVPGGSYPYVIFLPPGSWEILGRLNGIQDEVAARLVEYVVSPIVMGYRDYLAIGYKEIKEAIVDTSTESLKSFFRSNGVEGNLLILKQL